MERFARELGTQVRWFPGGDSDLMPALARFQLHMVIGGLTGATPWSRRVALSRPYFDTRFVVGSPTGSKLRSIRNRPVAVREGSALVAVLDQRGALPVPVPDLRAADAELVAAPSWQLPLLDRQPVGVELHRQRQVIAVPPGENAFLMRLNRFLAGQKAEVTEALQRQAVLP